MEDIGKINSYPCRSCGSVTFTINMNVGTTPFMIRCPCCGKVEASSTFYRFAPLDSHLRDKVKCSRVAITVTHCWYRPTKEQLDKKPEVKEHVLNGGLILMPIGTGAITPDDVSVDWTFEQWVQFARARYDSNPMLTDILSTMRKEDES